MNQEEQREKATVRQQRYRHRNALSRGVTAGDASSRPVDAGDYKAEAEAEAEKRDLPLPPESEPGTRIRPVADPLGMPAPYKRPDVLRVHAAWKFAFGYDRHRFRGYADPEALIVATAIDVHSEAECMLVLAHAPADGMVSGRDDQRKTKHESLGYIFGNEQTFARILRAAQAAEQAKTSESPSDRIARLKAREGAA
jgi:hypothetical protein